MKALLIEGSVQEIADLVKATGMTPLISATGAGPAPGIMNPGGDIERFIADRVRGNSEKERLVRAYADGIAGLDTLRLQVGIKEDGTENDYFTGRLTTLAEDYVGNVIYCRPSSTRVAVRLPVEAAEGYVYATRIESGKSGAEFAKVKHQVTIKLVNDDAVAEAIALTKLAVDTALNE